MAEDDKNPLNNVERLTDVVAEEIEPNPLEVEIQAVEELPSGQVEMEDGSILVGDVEGMFDEGCIIKIAPPIPY